MNFDKGSSLLAVRTAIAARHTQKYAAHAMEGVRAIWVEKSVITEYDVSEALGRLGIACAVVSPDRVEYSVIQERIRMGFNDSAVDPVSMLCAFGPQSFLETGGVCGGYQTRAHWHFIKDERWPVGCSSDFLGVAVAIFGISPKA